MHRLRAVSEWIANRASGLRDRLFSRPALIVLALLVAIACVVVMVTAQNKDAELMTRSNISIEPEPGLSVGFVRVPPPYGEWWEDPPKEDSWERVAWMQSRDWGYILVTDATFDPEGSKLTLHARYNPYSKKLADDNYTGSAPLQRRQVWYAERGSLRLKQAESQTDNSQLDIVFPIPTLSSTVGFGKTMWPYDRYSSDVYMVLQSPAWLLEDESLAKSTVTIAEGHVLPLLNGYTSTTEGLKVLPVGVGCTDEMTFSAPPGYHLNINPRYDSELDAPYLALEVRQELSFPRRGFGIVAGLLASILVLLSTRIIGKRDQGAHLLDVGLIILTMVFGLSLLSGILKEPSITRATWVDVLTFSVIVVGLVLVSICFLLEMRERLERH